VEETVEETVEESFKDAANQIIGLIKQNPVITIKEIEQKIKLTRRGIEYNIDKLKKSGVIKRIGSTKGGRWEVIE
jgi:ATP-dependent DNA helicase RecG